MAEFFCKPFSAQELSLADAGKVPKSITCFDYAGHRFWLPVDAMGKATNDAPSDRHETEAVVAPRFIGVQLGRHLTKTLDDLSQLIARERDQIKLLESEIGAANKRVKELEAFEGEILAVFKSD